MDHKLNQKGELTIIWGPMFSGKTHALISKLERFTSVNIEVLAINHVIDKRYAMNGLRAHNGMSFPSVRTENLDHIYSTPDYQKARVIGIDEVQFFHDIVSHVLHMVEKDHKIVFVAGLNGTYQRKLFGEWHNLIPLSDHIITLHAVCSDCCDGVTPGIFTKRIEHEDELVLKVGGQDTYKPVCRYHFLH